MGGLPVPVGGFETGVFTLALGVFEGAGVTLARVFVVLTLLDGLADGFAAPPLVEGTVTVCPKTREIRTAKSVAIVNTFEIWIGTGNFIDQLVQKKAKDTLTA